MRKDSEEKLGKETWNLHWYMEKILICLWIQKILTNRSIKTISVDNFKWFLLLEPRMPNLSSGFPCVTPPKSRSTMKAVILSFTCPSFSTISVLANTVKTLARPPLDIQTCFQRGKKYIHFEFITTVLNYFATDVSNEWSENKLFLPLQPNECSATTLALLNCFQR